MNNVQAQFAYRSAFHKYTKEYAQLYCDRYIILSAKYGLIEPTFLIPSAYDVTFSRATDPYISSRVLQQQALQYSSAKKLIVLCLLSSNLVAQETSDFEINWQNEKECLAINLYH